MTLSDVPRYRADQVTRRGEHAVVVGGSMAGLIAARVLADAYDEVTIVERDPLPDEPRPRRGVPQSHHVHVLLEAGRATLEDLLPGFGEDLLSAGALVVDWNRDLVYYDQGDALTAGTKRLPMYVATRPLFEYVVRRGVTDLDGVRLRAGCQFSGFLADNDATTVEGVEVTADAGTTELAADLVVDATGRTSRTPTWLDDHGYPTPRVDEVTVDVAYSSILLDRPEGDRRTWFSPPSPPQTRGGGAFPVEDGRWLVTLQGVHGDHPPTDPDEFRAFAASLPGPDLASLVDDHAWVSEDVDYYPFPSNLRRRYEDLDRFPDGLVVVGDAIASFNPIYGQGMSVAALEALQLHHALSAGQDDLAPRFFDRAADVVEVAWSMAVGGDFRWADTEGPKPRGTDLFNRYLSRLFRGAHTDSRLADALGHVIMMEQPPTSLLRPGVVRRVLFSAE